MRGVGWNPKAPDLWEDHLQGEWIINLQNEVDAGDFKFCFLEAVQGQLWEQAATMLAWGASS